ncbi:secondary thiamine-phosphate synthase enzyme YjbQ [Limnoglobus roseus]|uniref:YjbQ family protein n=1 Tax=Limnoglobus roseus TaxID=2598579 RepID=A0A5C1ALU4_9BACT|nr:secondary thiamine-phosphate synthase enzyme YjbQ [Limnoglobus roseus]QEL19123.1 YjbQ family protein [Limnoglobus roseus]
MIRLTVPTQSRSQFVEITEEIQSLLLSSGVKTGSCIVYVPHTTAGITIQENADPDVVHDILLWLNQHVSKNFPGFRHAEGNSDSHIKASLFGSSVTVLIENGKLVFGTWQGIYLCEFDGPRTRSVFVQIHGS